MNGLLSRSDAPGRESVVDAIGCGVFDPRRPVPEPLASLLASDNTAIAAAAAADDAPATKADDVGDGARDCAGVVSGVDSSERTPPFTAPEACPDPEEEPLSENKSEGGMDDSPDGRIFSPSPRTALVEEPDRIVPGRAEE